MSSRSSRINRRQFLEGTLGGIALASVARAQAPATGTLGANERIRIGCIGTGGQGTHHVGQWAKMNDVRIVAVCDVDQGRLENAAKVSGSSPDMTKDFREVLGRKDIDAVCIATPDHWHTPLAIRACQAGKHIYVEKPISHNVREGRAIADAARKAGVVVLHGTQQRSSSHWGNAVTRIKDGEIGKVNMVHAWNAWSTEQMFANIGRRKDENNTPAAGRRLRHVARTGTEAEVQSGALPWDFLLLLGLCRRHGQRLGRPPFRHRHVGDGLRFQIGLHDRRQVRS